jgi:phage head maturation protease
MESWNEEDEIDDEKDLRVKANGKKIMVRTIRDFASLMDVGVVTYPAYGNF